MKKLLHFVKNSFRTLFHSMRTRLIVSFSIPIMLLMLLAILGVHRVLLEKNRVQILDNAMSRYVQSYALIDSYVETMAYVSDSIYYNGNLQSIVGSKTFAKETPMDERYREFLVLDNVFSASENAGIIFRSGIFLHDDIPYTNNRIHIMSLEELFERQDYMRYVYTAQRGRMYYSSPVKVVASGTGDPVEVVTLLRPINSTDGTARQICIAQICVEKEAFQEALSHANSTDHTFVYLADEYKQLIVSTDEERYWQLKGDQALPSNGEDADWTMVEMEGESYYLMRQFQPESRWTLVCMIPEADVQVQVRYLSILFSILTVAIFAAIISVAVMLSNSYTRRLQRLNQLIQRVRSGELKGSRHGDRNHDEISELFDSFSEMTEELQNLMKQQYRSGKAVKTAELRALQAQINPHFLYNTLDLINWEAFEHDAPEISEIAQNLAKFYRICLNKGRQVVTIGEELQHVEAYVSIENRHFDDNIRLDVDVPADIRGLACINIILQPFVENAILHGFAKDTARSSCQIRIWAEREEADIRIFVSDDGPGMTAEQIAEIMQKNTVHHASGYGIKNIQSRLQLSFGEKYGVSFLQDGTPGTTACILIPALTPEEAERITESEV